MNSFETIATVWLVFAVVFAWVFGAGAMWFYFMWKDPEHKLLPLDIKRWAAGLWPITLIVALALWVCSLLSRATEGVDK